MKLLNADHSVLMEVTRFERDGNNLVIKGSIMGAMPVHAVLTPTETRTALGQLGFRLLLFVFTLLFRS
jgi:hypothetical protein